jgi:hypothetical protein
MRHYISVSTWTSRADGAAYRSENQRSPILPEPVGPFSSGLEPDFIAACPLAVTNHVPAVPEGLRAQDHSQLTQAPTRQTVLSLARNRCHWVEGLMRDG